MSSLPEDVLRRVLARRAFEAPDEVAGVDAARALFFQAVHRIEQRVVRDLMDKPLTLYRPMFETGLASVPEEQRHSWHAFEWYPTWNMISYASEHDSHELDQLRDLLLSWSRKWRLEDHWCLEAAAETLAILSAAGDAAELQPLHYPGLRMIELPFSDSELRFDFSYRGWSPTLTSWEDAEAYIDEQYREAKKAYRERIDALCHERGLQPVRRTRNRAGDHFEWVARFQVGRELWTEIAERETAQLETQGKPAVTPDAVAKAVRDKAQLLGLTLAEAERPGRPPGTSA